MTTQIFKIAPLSPLYKFLPPSLIYRPQGGDLPPLGNPSLQFLNNVFQTRVLIESQVFQMISIKMFTICNYKNIYIHLFTTILVSTHSSAVKVLANLNKHNSSIYRYIFIDFFNSTSFIILHIIKALMQKSSN